MTAGERLAKLADLLSACPPPDMAGGYDQCAHGTWPCVITQAAWLAQGRDRDQEVRAACQELRAAEREGRPPSWEAEAEPGPG
jgi:hypothetical protein